MQEHFPAATVGSQDPGEDSREKNFKVAATEAGVRFFFEGKLLPKFSATKNFTFAEGEGNETDDLWIGLSR